MAYTKKEWTDRNVQYPGRRKLSAVSGQTDVYDVVRNEGTITAAGDAFSAENMNDLEDRVEAGFNAAGTYSDEILKSAKKYADDAITKAIGDAIGGDY